VFGAPPAESAVFGAPPARQAAFTEHSGAFPIGDPASMTGPMPAVEDSPLERGDEFLPIFASVESAWFQRPPADDAAVAPGGEGRGGFPPPESQTASPSSSSPDAQPGEGGWRSRADSGFEAAASVKDPQMGGLTAAGLPKRTPKANLVPGSVGTESSSQAPRPPVSAEAVRSRLSSFQQGVQRGRAQMAGGSAEGSGNEEEGS
jgi:hypothetical protein